MRTAIAILMSGALLAVAPDPQREIAGLKTQVRTLERQLVIARAAVDAAGPKTMLMPNAPKELWSSADAFIEHVRLRDILGLRKADDSPATWLKQNKGFGGRAVTWQGVVTGTSSKNVVMTYITAGQGATLRLIVQRSRNPQRFDKGRRVIARGPIQKIDIQPAKIKDGQIIHGTIAVHIKGGLQGARTKDKR